MSNEYQDWKRDEVFELKQKSRPVNVHNKMTPEELDELKLLVNATFK